MNASFNRGHLTYTIISSAVSAFCLTHWGNSLSNSLAEAPRLQSVCPSALSPCTRNPWYAS